MPDTADTPSGGTRGPGRPDWRTEFAYTAGVQAFVYGFPYIYYATLRHAWVTDERDPEVVPYAAVNHFWHAARLLDASDPGLHSAVTWQEVDWLRSLVKSKLLLKGVLHPGDAKLALQAGVDGIMVSNHGGRNLDTIIPSIEALPEVAQEVAGRVPLFVDGGIRRGTDVLKALARGANAVLIGRPYLYALAVAGADGVARCLSLLIQELRFAMALVGSASLQELNRDVEWLGPAVRSESESPRLRRSNDKLL